MQHFAYQYTRQALVNLSPQHPQRLGLTAYQREGQRPQNVNVSQRLPKLSCCSIMDAVLYIFLPLGISSDRKGPCQNLLRGSEEKYSQSQAHKGDMKKGGKGGEGESEINTKVHGGTNHQKEGCFCVCVHTFEQIDSHWYVRFALRKGFKKRMPVF